MRDDPDATFGAADYSVLGMTLLISMAIGIFYALQGRKSKSAKEYFTANGTMGLIPTTLSLLASVLCSIWYIGFPAEVYEYGFHFAWDYPMIPVALVIVAYGFVPVFYELRVTSANEYLEKRFNRSIRMIGSVMYIANSGLYVAMVTYIPALSVSQVTGLHLWLSIALMSLIGTTYTALGGIRAVMWTDVFQMLIIYVSMIAVIIKGTIDLGGISLIFERSIEGHRVALPPLTADPRYRYNIGTVFLICCLYWLGLYGTYQTQVQRYLSSPSLKNAQKAVWFNMLAFLSLETIIVYISLMLYAHFHDCDPKMNKAIDTYDELLTYFVMKTFRNIPGLPGLFVSGVFSGALSTISSCLNSMAAVTMEDFVLAIPRFQKIKDGTRTKISRWLALIYGVLTIGLMVFVEKLGSVITFWGYNNGTIMGSNAGVFVLGLFVPWANSAGALVGLIFACGWGLLVAIGAQVSGVTFESEPMSVAGCNATFIHNVSALINGSISHVIPTSTEAISSTREALYSILPERGGFQEMFTVSPHILQPLTLLMTVIVGGFASLLFRNSPIKCGINLELISPLLRPLVKFYRKRFAGKIGDQKLYMAINMDNQIKKENEDQEYFLDHKESKAQDHELNNLPL